MFYEGETIDCFPLSLFDQTLLGLSFQGVGVTVAAIVILVLVLTLNIVGIRLKVDRTLLRMMIVSKLDLCLLHVLVYGLLLLHQILLLLMGNRHEDIIISSLSVLDEEGIHSLSVLQTLSILIASIVSVSRTTLAA